MSPAICFKRWSRKNYAVFASLHHVVKIGVVTFSCTLVQVCYQSVFAQVGSISYPREETALEEVEISASQPLPWSALPFSVQSVEQKDIAAAPVSSLEYILEYLPGVDIRQRGPDGTQADISLNGGSFDQVLILLNGVNITDPQTGHYNLDIPLDLSQVSRIDVLRGSAAGILGSNAFSGAINLITTPSSYKNGFIGKVELDIGSFHRRQGRTELSYSSDRLSLQGACSYKTSEGYIPNTDYQLLNGNVQAGYRHPSMGTFLLQMGYQQKDVGANSFYSLAYPNQYDATASQYSALTWDKSLERSYLQAQLYQRRHHDRFELFRDMIDAAPWYTGHNYHLTDVTGGKFTVGFTQGNHYDLMGAEIRNEHIYSTVLGNPLSTPREDPFDPSALFIKAKNRSTLSGVFHHRMRFSQVVTSVGATFNYTPDIGVYWQGGLDGRLAMGKETTVTLNINRSLRLPTFTDLYYQSATQRSNPDLKPEEAVTLEARLDKQTRETTLSLSCFHRWGSHLIDWIRKPDSTKWESRNLTAIQTTGYTAEMGWHPQRRHLSSIIVDYSFLYLNKTANGFDSRYALDYLKHKVDIRASGRLFETRTLGAVSLQINAGYFDRSGTFNDPVTNSPRQYDPYWLIDTRITWKRGRVVVFTDVCNVLDATYTDFGGLSQPGRNVRTGLNVSF